MASTPSPPSGPQSTLEAEFRGRLDEHGYGFQYAVQRHVTELFAQRRSFWTVEVAEFPVEHRGRVTHIDLILSLRSEPSLPFFLVAECKRANPALSDWCFVRTPETRNHGQVVAESLMVSTTGVVSTTGAAAGRYAEPEFLWQSEKVYNLGFPIKDSNKKGDKAGEGRSVLDEAIVQVWRGTSGFIGFLGANLRFLRVRANHAHGLVMPVIFTTANLWTSSVDISGSDLTTGTVPTTNLTKVSYVWLKHNLSPDLRHSFDSGYTADKSRTLQDHLMLDYTRCVGIVTASGIEEFVRFDHWSAL